MFRPGDFWGNNTWRSFFALFSKAQQWLKKKNTVGWWFYPKKYESSQPLIPSLAKQQ